jgi:ADP-heptose:LPS heptosyltransferase
MRKFRILVSRPDRLGDVVLSTPVLEALKRRFPHAELTVLVQAPIVPVVEGLDSVDRVFLYEPAGRHAGVRGFMRLLRELRSWEFRVAVCLQSDRRIAWAVRLARIRHRVGPYSKPHSWLTYNRGLRQRRSQVESHEADYNLQLLRRLGARVASRELPTRVALRPAAVEWAKSWLGQQGFSEGVPSVLVHPGMGGSALNWPETHYVELAAALLREGTQVLITAGPTEGEILERFRAGLAAAARASSEGSGGVAREKARGMLAFYGGREAGSLDKLVALISRCDVVVAPSTGPLHLAVALDRRVVSFFPPIRVQSALRWGPYVADETRASVLVPDNYCGEDFRCRGNLCHYYPCMRSLTVAQALEQVRTQLVRR